MPKMSRDEAIDAVCAAMPRTTWSEANKFVAAVEALGLVTFEKLRTPEDVLRNLIITANPSSPSGSGWMIGDYGAERIIAVLRGAGFKVER
jgi:hypothetical protein